MSSAVLPILRLLSLPDVLALKMIRQESNLQHSLFSVGALPIELRTIKKHTVAAALKASDLMDVPHPVCLFMADRRGIEPRPLSQPTAFQAVSPP